jgi:hypothetical protein
LLRRGHELLARELRTREERLGELPARKMLSWELLSRLGSVVWRLGRERVLFVREGAGAALRRAPMGVGHGVCLPGDGRAGAAVPYRAGVG